MCGAGAGNGIAQPLQRLQLPFFGDQDQSRHQFNQPLLPNTAHIKLQQTRVEPRPTLRSGIHGEILQLNLHRGQLPTLCESGEQILVEVLGADDAEKPVLERCCAHLLRRRRNHAAHGRGRLHVDHLAERADLSCTTEDRVEEIAGVGGGARIGDVSRRRRARCVALRFAGLVLAGKKKRQRLLEQEDVLSRLRVVSTVGRARRMPTWERRDEECDE